MGIFIGDGFTAYYGYYLTQFIKHRHLDELYREEVLIPLVKGTFNIPPHTSKDGNTRRVNYYSRDLYELLTERFNMPADKKCFKVKIQQEILESDQAFIAAALRGIADTNGTVFFDTHECYKKPYPRIQVSTSSSEIANQIKEILVGMELSLYFNKRGLDTKSSQFYIEIYSVRQLNKWHDKIGFSNPTRIYKIQEYAPVA